MPAPDTRDKSLWIKSKINDGLMAAQVAERERKWVEATFIGLPKPTQQALIDAVGGFGIFASDKNKVKRDLCRAMNAALAFDALLHGRKYVYDRVWREKILTRLDLTSAQRVVLAQVNAAYTASQPLESFEPITLPGPEAVIHTAVPPPVLPRAHPVSASVDKPGAGWKKLRLAVAPVARANVIMKSAATAFQTEGSERHDRLDAMVAQQTGEIGMVWTRASMTVREAVNDLAITNLQNLSSFNAVITSAYASYDQNVKDNQEALKNNVAMVGKMFSALKSAPPPLSFIGAIGETVAGAVKVQDGLDPRSRFESLKGPRASGFFCKLTAGLDALRDDTLRIGPDLSSLGSVSSLQDTLHRVCKSRMDEMSKVLRKTCDEHFGATSDVLQHFHSVVGDAVASGRGAIQGRIGVQGETYSAAGADGKSVRKPVAGQTNSKAMICARIEQYQNELLEEMRPAIEFPKLFAPQDAGYAMEMMLYSNYIVAMYESKVYRLKPVADGIVNFFARAEPWGVLMVESTQEVATEKQRLKWVDDTNHKQMLVMFCDWYLKNVNPFMLITGARRNGVLYTPKLIEVMCRTQIDKINAAVNVGRTKGVLTSSWNWKAIEKEYARLCRQ
jgi:hypothetical protein